jgi:signal peptidase I
VKVSDLKIFRDKYYIACDDRQQSSDYDTFSGDVRETFRDPTGWGASELFDGEHRRFVEFAIEEDQFLPLGDNSPASSDGRYWYEHHYVERDLLIGKALLIYWPHTWNRPIPFTPNFPKMGPVR